MPRVGRGAHGSQSVRPARRPIPLKMPGPEQRVLTTAPQGKTRFEWTMERKVAVLTEVAAAGEAAFKTFKDGVAADGDARTQKEVWTHESDGILSLAKKHYSLHGTTFPAYGSVIASVKGWVQVGRTPSPFPSPYPPHRTA